VITTTRATVRLVVEPSYCSMCTSIMMLLLSSFIGKLAPAVDRMHAAVGAMLWHSWLMLLCQCAGRETLAKLNPLVQADRITRF
jgi:hypothetical protein